MDANLQKIEALINTHVANAESARKSLGRSFETLKHNADIPARVKEKIRKRPIFSFSLAALGGLSISRIFRRPKRIIVAPTAAPKTSIKKMLFQAAFSAAKPAIQAWVATKIKNQLAARIQKSHKPSRHPIP